MYSAPANLQHQPDITLASLVETTTLDDAWRWLCNRRKNYPASADIWWLRQNWQHEKSRLQQLLLHGHYQFEPLQQVTRKDGEVIELWSARDALVLKMLSIVLANAFNLSDRCTHTRGHGGIKRAVTEVAQALPDYRFVFRTDVKSFYASIDHLVLYEQLCDRITDKGVRRLLWQYLRRTVERGGLFRDVEKGISLGCPLSPLMGAICLIPVDQLLTDNNLFYIRFMDDWVVLAKTRRHLRRAVKQTNQLLDRLKLEKHPDKTFIGLIEKGFDFLGHRFSRGGVRLAKSTVNNFYSRLSRLYEQARATPAGVARVWDYVERWPRWVQSVNILCNFELIGIRHLVRSVHRGLLTGNRGCEARQFDVALGCHCDGVRRYRFLVEVARKSDRISVITLGGVWRHRADL